MSPGMPVTHGRRDFNGLVVACQKERRNLVPEWFGGPPETCSFYDKMRAKPITRSSKSLRSYKMRTKSPPETEKSDDGGEIGDRSVLRSSIDTSVSNLYQLSKLFENGTSELCELLTNECSVIYECKVCRNLFRSVANFISHKRTYCVTKYVDVQEQILLNARGTTIKTRTTSRQDIISMLDGIIEKQPDKGLTNNTVVLKEMNSTSEGLINCSHQGQQNLSSEKYATLGPDGRIVEENEEEEDETSMCNVCQKTFLSQKLLAAHVKLEHSNSRMYFVCPCCKKYFANSWSVYRHLYKVHRKSNEQVRKLRPQIKRKQVKLNVLMESRKSPQKSSEEKQYDQDKAWMEELEGNIELQRCLGCGKKFDRRVALISHSQMCQKRLAIIHKLPKRRPPTPPKPEPDRKSRIQVRMFYDKVNNRSKELPEIIPTSNSSEMESDIGLSKIEPISNVPPPTMDKFIPDKDVTDVVSRYKREVDIHDKCRRLEAKLLQLHKVAVEEIEGSLSEKLPESHSSIQECIGTITPTKDDKENNEEQRATIEGEEETFDPPTFIVSTTSEISKTVVEEEEEQSHSAPSIPENDSQTVKNVNCNGISSCNDSDVIVIEDDDDYNSSDIEITYISGGDTNKNFQMTDEGDVTSTISIPNITSEDSGNITDHISGTTAETYDSDSSIAQNDSQSEESERFGKINACINKTLKKCLVCYRSFSSLVQAKRHVALHFNVYKYRCKVNSCKFKSYLRRDMIRHMERNHNKKGIVSIWYQRLDSDEESEKSSGLKKLNKKNMNSANGLSRRHKQNNPSKNVNDCEINLLWEGELKLNQCDDSNVESQPKNHLNGEAKNSSSDEEDCVHNETSPLNDDNLKAQMMEIIFGTEDDSDVVFPQIFIDEVFDKHQ